ncbi:MAG: diguanylate cyclase [Magnetococcales bacterium]|nr:diguanylate cyclase [Magnetococcales bacterium]
MQILIVDDAPANIRFLGGILRDDYEILVATDGAKALAVAAEEKPDLILLDITMPGLDGYETCRRLKATPGIQNIPVVFVTALDHEDDETRGLELGAIDYLTKPCSPAIVKARVRNHLELKRVRDTLERLSTLDGLTGVDNRRSFDERLELEWRRALRNRSSIGLLLLDIDYFKGFNDFYGHGAGDECLKQVALTLKGAMRRSSDFFARYGGEEFVAILPQTDENGALSTAEIMRQAVEGLAIPHEKSAIGPYVTISLGGMVLIPHREITPGQWQEATDKNLYAAKKAGRNQALVGSMASV